MLRDVKLTKWKIKRNLVESNFKFVYKSELFLHCVQHILALNIFERERLEDRYIYVSCKATKVIKVG